MLVHCLSRLGAAVTILTTKRPCRNGVFAEYTLEHAKPVHQFDCVISHNFSVVAYPTYDPKLKFCSRLSSRLRLRLFGISMARSPCFLHLTAPAQFYAFDPGGVGADKLHCRIEPAI